MLDLAIRGGTVVDGTGRPGRRADVGIRDGRIVAVGEVDGSARRTIDAEGLTVAPGLIDVHTHYDAQLYWDHAATPSCFHGVTTVLGGNCGFTLAPHPGGDYLMRLMARVEGIPLTALEAGLPWDWTSFADWMSRLDGQIAVNAGFLCGHSALRASIMYAAAAERSATPTEIERMVALLHESLDAGALGFSSSQTVNHNDGDGNPVPSRFATPDELLALAAAVSGHPGTSVEWISSGVINGFTADEVELLCGLSLASNRPVNWNALGVTATEPRAHWDRLDASTVAAGRGATVVALAVPVAVSTRLSFVHGFIIDGLPGWKEVLALPVPQRITALTDPAVRTRLAEGAASPEAGILRELVDWERITVAETFAPETAAYEGWTGHRLAESTGKSALDAILDVVVADELRTGLQTAALGDDPDTWRMRAETWRDPRVVIGGSDAGAHLDILCGAVASSEHLGTNVRDRQLLPLEQAIRQLTDVPARLYGLRARGRVEAGYWADVMIFDPATIAPGAIRTVADLPAGASRLYSEGVGVAHVLVNGTPIVSGGKLSGEEPGTLLRAGRDTDTVAAGTFNP
jgi:N-acyl-D-aspartate/D-glutamate deacylase